MENGKIKLYILHAGLGHPSPYFYNLCKELEKYKEIEVMVNPDLPIDIKEENGIVYFNRLKRYYNSQDINSVYDFLKKIDILKQNGWKLAFTIHNFFPIDRAITKNDEILLEKILPKMDIIFTLTDYMKNKLKERYNISAYNHSIGKNVLDNKFDKIIDLPEIDQDSFVFTFVGNINEYKMLDKVIDNFNKIKEEKKYLIIAGPDTKNYSLDKKNEKIFRINEFIGDTIWKKLSQMTDVFINSYDIKRECFKYGFFPSNCVQIASLKKICIVPECDEIKELLPANYYFTYDNPDNLYKVFEKIIDNKKKIYELEKTYPEVNYSWSKTVKILVNELKKLV